MQTHPPAVAAALKAAAALKSVNRFVAILCGAALLIAVVLILLEVAGRQFPAMRLGGADEISGYVMAGIATWGFSYALVERAHVRIDVLHMKLPQAGRAVLDILSLASIVLVAVLVAWYAYDVFGKSVTRGSRSNTPLGIQLWIPQLVWFAGWAWLTLTSAILLLVTLVLAAARRWDAIDRVAGANSETGEAA